MKEYEQSIIDHYGRADIDAHILEACERAGKQITLHGDTASFDEFHIRGREATRELAKLAEVHKGMTVLDLGCGVGGPARTLAAEFGCRVWGIDLLDEYCRCAAMLTERVGLAEMVTFRQGDMPDLPFEDQDFDAAWTEHTIMNIEDKGKLFAEIRRILRPNGTFALYEICEGSASPPHFPLPWASDQSISFLAGQDALREMLREAGFEELLWRDVTERSLEWFRGVVAAIKPRKDDAPRLGLNLLMGKTAADKSKNIIRNLKEDRIRVVQGVFRRGE
ncbi:MAG: methyltransferase domain-containing protein [Deltaproteobacteria bacterium]|nr:methyltransferase domain-containing protein [Deltaproteobacteria bacterium]